MSAPKPLTLRGVLNFGECPGESCDAVQRGFQHHYHCPACGSTTGILLRTPIQCVECDVTLVGTLVMGEDGVFRILCTEEAPALAEAPALLCAPATPKS